MQETRHQPVLHPARLRSVRRDARVDVVGQRTAVWEGEVRARLTTWEGAQLMIRRHATYTWHLHFILTEGQSRRT